MSDLEEDVEKLAYIQRLKAAVHYTVGTICEKQASDADLTVTKHFIAALSEVTFKYSQMMAKDLELFAKHAKRSTINVDDVKLLVRKSPQLLQYIQNVYEEKQSASLAKKHTSRKKKSRTREPEQMDEDSS